MVVTLGLSLNQRSFLFLHLSESEKQTSLSDYRTIVPAGCRIIATLPS